MKTLEEIISQLSPDCHECGEPERAKVLEAAVNHLTEIGMESVKLTPFDLDQWFFTHPDQIKPPELCRNRREKIVYFKSEVDVLIAQIGVLKLKAKVGDNIRALKEEIVALKAELEKPRAFGALRCGECGNELLTSMGARMKDEITSLKKQLEEKDAYIQKLIKDGKQRIANSIMKDARIAELEKECESAKELLQKADGALSFFDNDKSSPLMWEIFDFLKPKETP